MTAPIVLESGGGRVAEIGATLRFLIKAGAEQTRDAYSFVEAEGASFASPHIHRNREESFFVVEGNFTFLAGEERVDVGPGAFVLVQRGTMHAFRSHGEGRLLIVHSPGGFEGYFRELASAIADGSLSIELRDVLAERYGMTYHDDIAF